MKKSNNKIILTGGHAGTAALSVAEEIQKQNLNWEIHWMGPKNAMEGKKALSLEFKYFEKLNIRFHSIIFGKLHRKFSIWVILSIFKIPVGFVQALFYLMKIKPFVVLSFGGFASFPVVFVSKVLKIPVLIHEQTAVAGRANIYSSRFADKILLSRGTSKGYFPKSKSLVVGNPILSQYFINNNNNLQKTDIKTILIIGGSRGSQQINRLIKQALEKLLDKYKIIHLTGELDFKEFENIKNNLSKGKSNYNLFSSVDPYEMLGIYKKANLVISRAGANTVSELIALNIPSVFIPIPWVYLDEQTKNAEYASKFIPSVILNQNNITIKKLFDGIEYLINQSKGVESNNYLDKEASKKIVILLSNYLK